MKRFTFLSLLLSVIVLGISNTNAAETIETDELESPEKKFESKSVIKLTSQNFDEKVGSGGIWLVEFYADWCGHCKRFASTYTVIASNLHTKNGQKAPADQIHVGKVDGSKERILSSRFSIRGYPVFFVIDGWNVYEYNGIRSLDALSRFVERDYKKEEPLRFYNSPFGPIGQTRAFIMKAGTFILSQYETLTKEKSYSSVIATLLIAGVGVVIGTFVILLFGLLLVSKQKSD